MLDGLAKEMAHRFGLGASAGPLLDALLSHVDSSWPDGWSGMLARFRRIGYGTEVATWLGEGFNQTIPPEAVEEALSMEAIEGIAERVGMNPRTASEALAYAIPEVVSQLTPTGEIPASLPAWGAGAAPIPTHSVVVSPELDEVRDSRSEQPVTNRFQGWTAPVALAVIVLAITAFSLRGQSVTPKPVKPKVLSEAVERPSTVRLAPATLIVKRGGSGLTYSGVVRDREDKESLESALKESGASGSVEVDLGVSRANWIPALAEVLRDAPRGLEMSFENYKLTLAGLPKSQLNERKELLADRLTGQYEVHILDLDATATSANAEALEAVRAVVETQDASPADLVQALNKMVINFRSGSVQIPEANREILAIAAKMTLSSKIVISGYTDSSGSASGNEQLSQRRAEEIRRFMIREGADESMLEARGMGATNPIASNDTESGRFSNRRIEFSLGTD